MSREGREFGSKIGGAGQAAGHMSDRARKERLRQLALETIDLSKDPYLRRNYQGQVDCTLCMTVHHNESNYLTHTQGKRHQSNLARRAMVEAKRGARAAGDTFLAPQQAAQAPARRSVRIGRPGYRVTKQRDARSGGLSLLFELDYPDIERGAQPRHRFMSAYEQRVVPAPRGARAPWQLILFAAEPYETVAFQIPNEPLVREAGSELFFTHWDADTSTFFLQLTYKNDQAADHKRATAVNEDNGTSF